MTAKQLAAMTGASINAIGKVLAKNRGTKFRVADWSHVGAAALWELSSGPDAPRRTPHVRRSVPRIPSAAARARRAR